jgi:hypothetical protein
MQKKKDLVSFQYSFSLLLYWQCGCSDKDINDVGNVCEYDCYFLVNYPLVNSVVLCIVFV